ncbi:hypothetical protein FRC03_002937 [Tulasnella sp. 419]|nr:hypothetical protein FRC03_002937 [Tulasnella sp. 419]
MLSQLETWHNLTETEKDRTIGSSASLVSLELYVMDIEPSDVEPTVRALMEILPHELALRVFIRPITYREEGDGAKEDEIEGKQEGAGLDRNVAMEAEFKRLIESYRVEREGGGKV